MFLHIGTPKSGTTHLQGLLWANRRQLRTRGMLYPGRGPASQYRAVLELLALDSAPRAEHPMVQWTALLAQIRRSTADVIISHELLTFANEPTVHRIAADLADREVHLVITARDLRRLIPSKWQEDVRNGEWHTYRAMINSLMAEPPHGAGRVLWRMADLPALISGWSPVAPPHRVHVVVNGPPGTRVNLLPELFLATLDTSLDGLSAPDQASYRSLSAQAAELMRRINAGPARSLAPGQFQSLVKLPLGYEVLTSVGTSLDRLTVPPEHRGWVADRSEEIVAGVAGMQVDIRGNLADLAPESVDDSPFVDPGSYSDTVLLELACEALVAQATRTAGPGRLGTHLPERVSALVSRARGMRA